LNLVVKHDRQHDHAESQSIPRTELRASGNPEARLFFDPQNTTAISSYELPWPKSLVIRLHMIPPFLRSRTVALPIWLGGTEDQDVWNLEQEALDPIPDLAMPTD
jgi:hypothetical protein